ncbi:hypothetical protein BGX38DRAFT_1226889 [Terfezia claveryi]|nr:hypothetical protein BGX38DRAFT_1226889 [Terfezia claveryi]
MVSPGDTPFFLSPMYSHWRPHFPPVSHVLPPATQFSTCLPGRSDDSFLTTCLPSRPVLTSLSSCLRENAFPL